MYIRPAYIITGAPKTPLSYERGLFKTVLLLIFVFDRVRWVPRLLRLIGGNAAL